MNQNFIKLASPDIREEDIQRVVKVLRSENLIQGLNVKRLEEIIIEYTRIPYCSLVSSGTAALHLSLMALGISKGDAVIVPAFTFPATANVVEIVGGEVILCDVDLESYVINPDNIERAMEENKSKNIKAIIVVHEFGYPAEIYKISKIAKKHNMLLIEDAACAFGTIVDGHFPGYYSDLACYSFHPRKAITTGEGGAVVSTNLNLIKKIHCLKNHGIENINEKIEYTNAGLNYRITDFQAALAIGQLDRFSHELIKRKRLADLYYKLLRKQNNLTLPKYHENHSWQSYMITLYNKINRAEVIKILIEKNIQTNLGAQAVNCLNYYKQKYNYNEHTHPNSTKLYNNGLVLPLYGNLTLKNINYIANTLIEIIKNNYA